MKNKLGNVVYKSLVGGVIVAGFSAIVYVASTAKSIPNNSKVQEGYIPPSQLEVQCKDLDGNGEPETILRIRGKSYLLRDVDGRPALSAYVINPVDGD